MENRKIVFLVSHGNVRVVIWAIEREEAKRQAHRWIGADPAKYTVSPLTNPGDRVKLDITLNI